MMISTIIDVVLTFYQSVLMVYLIKAQVTQKPHPKYYEIAAVLLTAFFMLSIQYLHLPLPDSLTFLIPLLFIRITSDESWTFCIFWTIVDMLLAFGTLTLVGYFFNVQISLNGSASAGSETILITYSFVGTSAMTVVFCIAARFRNLQNEISHKETIMFIGMLMICFLLNECFFMIKITENAERYFLIASICLLILMVLTMLLYERLTNAARRQRMAELTLQTYKLMTEHQAELKTIYTAMLAEQHDLRHRIAAAEEMLSSVNLTDHDRADVRRLLERPEQPQIFITGNTAIDAIIKAKHIVMKNAGISFEFVEYPLHKLPIPEQDFCVLLANLLDNAIEGVMRLPATDSDRRIRLVFSKVWNMLFVTCENDADNSKVVRRGDEFVSSKPQKELHGFGTRTMKRIVEDAGGTIDFVVEPHRFTVKIMLGEELSG